MKKMKKILAMLMALTMVLGMTMTASAETETTVPSAADSKIASVQNVEPGAEVKAYQIIEGAYGADGNGFLGYKEVTPISGTLVNIIDETYLEKEDDRPTAEEVVAIASKINNHELTFDSANIVPMNQGTVNSETGLATYTGDLKAGYWVVLVRGKTNVYNPMLIGVYYDLDPKTDGIQGSGDNNTLVPDPSVDATTKWTLVATNAYAKSSAPSIEKTANVQTQNVGGTVEYTIVTQIPDYSEEYTSAKFEVKDTLTNLVLQKDTIVVKVGDEEVTDNETVCKITGNTENSTTFTVSFESAWLLERAVDDEQNVTNLAANAGKEVVITYKATVTDGAVNQTEAANNAELTYTNTPTGGEGHDKDIEKVYTFDIDGEVTNNILKKVEKGETEGSTQPLAGATFKMYTKMKELGETEDVVYSNTDSTDHLVNTGLEGAGTVESDGNGLLRIAGLAAGTYFIKEIEAPSGYSLNDNIYKIVITPTFDEKEVEELVSWTIVVTPYVKENGSYVEKVSDALTSKFDVNQKTEVENEVTIVKEDIGFVQNPTYIMNTKLIALPSTGGIGTTIFTVAGCGIMIAAAFFFFASRKKENE